MISYGEILARIVVAIVFGGVVGLEREHHTQPAGLKTHIILCVGATLITIISLKISYDFGTAQTDPARIAANIVTGIGFLGGGAILRMGATVRGLTTAACIWTVSGVGMAVGAGYYFPAALTILTVLLTLRYLGRVEKKLLNRKTFKQITLTARSSPDLLGGLEKVLSENGIVIKHIEVNRELAEPNVEVTALVTIPQRVNLNVLTDQVFQISGTLRFEVE
jgi:putative Mg2+ transporter-C (MgtC) family protein